MPDNWVLTDADVATAKELNDFLPARIFDAHAHLYRVSKLNMADPGGLLGAGPADVAIADWRRDLGQLTGERLQGAMFTMHPALRADDVYGENAYLQAQLAANPDCRGLLVIAPSPIPAACATAWPILTLLASSRTHVLQPPADDAGFHRQLSARLGLADCRRAQPAHPAAPGERPCPGRSGEPALYQRKVPRLSRGAAGAGSRRPRLPRPQHGQGHPGAARAAERVVRYGGRVRSAAHDRHPAGVRAAPADVRQRFSRCPRFAAAASPWATALPGWSRTRCCGTRSPTVPAHPGRPGVDCAPCSKRPTSWA